jgi:hypothetical protein
MRQGQQHRRGRGRNNNNNSHNHNHNHRKGHNPLSRSFESNGPDVKVRGTPAHIAEKYLSLARDAQSSGDPVLAENYLQHAEHYNRIIMTYREQQVQQPGEPMNGGAPRMRPEGGEELPDDQVDDIGNNDQPRFSQEQPRFQDQPPRNDEGRQHRSHDQGRFRDRHDRHQNRNQEMRQPRERNGEGHQPFSDDEGAQPARAEQRSEQPQQRRRERFGPGNEQPEFLRRPVRRPRREGSNGNGEGDDGVEGGRDEGSQDKTPA